MRLPASLGIGDWVYFRCMGAYTLAAGSTFNGMPRPGTVHMCGEMAARRLTLGILDSKYGIVSNAKTIRRGT